MKCNKNMKLNRIKAVLEEKGISQTWLSKKMGKSFSTVNALCVQSYPTQPYNASLNCTDIVCGYEGTYLRRE